MPRVDLQSTYGTHRDMLSAVDITNEVELSGFAILEDTLPIRSVAALLRALEEVNSAICIREGGGIFALRNLLDVAPATRQLAQSTELRNLVEPVLGPDFFAVRGILFDKIPGANWKVPWHQDVTIAVQERVEVEGFGPWSVKANVLHVQPPTVILEQMISVRLHLDNCGEENGALRVIPGSHNRGRIPEAQIARVREEKPEHVCEVATGGALLMRPLLLHASSASRVPGHRRVVHLDFASVHLPAGLRWYSETGPDPIA